MKRRDMHGFKKLKNKISFSYQTALLADDRLSFFKLFLFSFLSPTLHRFGVSIPSMTVVLSRFGGKARLFLKDYRTLMSLREIFIDGVYDVDTTGDVDIIFDVGANAGIVSIFFALKYPRARIFSVEASPRIFRVLEKNTKQFPHIKLINCAVTGENKKTLTFHEYENKSESSSLFNRGEGMHKYTIEGKTLSTIMDEHGLDFIDILKFDIEGSEWDAFNSFGTSSKVGCLVGEVHPDITGKSYESFVALIPGFTIRSEKLKNNRALVYGQKK